MDREVELQKVHSLELLIAAEIKRICEKNDIAYFITAGTLLGAVRHGGFIPWDDDMDFGMLRSDYEKFAECCENDLDSRFYLQNWEKDEDYPFSFSKIRLKGTHFVEAFSESVGECDGIFVDIFPFDSVPEEDFKRKIQGKRYYFYKRLLWIKKGMGKNMKNGNSFQKIKYYIFLFLSIFFNYEHAKRRFISIQKKYNVLNDSSLVVADGSYSYEKESIPRKWVEDLELISFEDTSFFSYKAKEEYLKHFYGDYMKLPPVEKRNRHELVRVDFGNY